MKIRKLKNIKYVIAFLIIISSYLISNNVKEIQNSKQNVENQIENMEESTNDEKSKEDLQVYFLDVGQGDSCLVIDKNNTMLIDAGNNEDGELISEFIKSLGISKINYLIATHPHEDHIGGMDNIIKNFDIDNIYMNEVTSNTKNYEEVLDAIQEKNLKVTVPKVEDEFYLNSATCKILSIENNKKNINNSSIVIEMAYNEKRFLFMGDAEIEIEKQIKSNKVDVLKVGHHGSKTSSSESF